ncbi:MAG: hypothetical protein WCG95_04250 [bacterium]
MSNALSIYQQSRINYKNLPSGGCSYTPPGYCNSVWQQQPSCHFEMPKKSFIEQLGEVACGLYAIKSIKNMLFPGRATNDSNKTPDGGPKTPDNNSKDNGNVSTEVNNANSSTKSLDEAIKACQQNGQVDELKTQVAQDNATQKVQADQIENMVINAQNIFNTDTKTFSDLNSNYQKEKVTLGNLETTKKSTEKEATEADNAVVSAQNSLDTATTNLSTAQQALTSATTPQARVTAQQKVVSAQSAYNNAKTTLDQAKANQKTKNDAKAKAQKDYDAQKTKVDKLVTDIATANTKLNKSKEALSQAQKNQTQARAANNAWGDKIRQAQAELSKYSSSTQK